MYNAVAARVTVEVAIDVVVVNKTAIHIPKNNNLAASEPELAKTLVVASLTHANNSDSAFVEDAAAAAVEYVADSD